MASVTVELTDVTYTLRMTEEEAVALRTILGGITRNSHGHGEPLELPNRRVFRALIACPDLRALGCMYIPTGTTYILQPMGGSYKVVKAP